MRAACEQLDVASQTPWVLLSAGVSFEEFTGQVRLAAQAGASGFLGGRAIWEEGLRISDGRERRRWLQTIGVYRMRRLHDLAAEYARPWYQKYGQSIAALLQVDALWYTHYR